MSIFGLAWRNLLNKPWSLALSVILFALGVGLISLLLLLDHQLQEKFEKNLAGIDLVIGAKGSPLQLILCSMYHIDAPTGNVKLEEARPFLNPKHPLIEKSVPLSLGDSYKTYRIVGTTREFFELYEAEIAEGRKWEENFEVVIGETVARNTSMSIGDEFSSSHGFLDEDHLAHDDAHPFKVVGILQPSGSVIDQLIICSPQSFWLVHDHGDEEPAATEPENADDDHDHDHEAHDHEGHEHGHDHEHEAHEHNGHDHEHDHDHEAHEYNGHDHEHDHDLGDVSYVAADLLEADPEREITSLLLKFKARNYQALNMQRSINENTDLQAATPAIEINRLFSLMSAGEKALRILAYIIIVVSGLSIFISLYSSLKDRKYELALMRLSGAGRSKLFLLIVTEGAIIAIMGYVIGMLLSHGGMTLFAGVLESSYRYTFSGLEFLHEELLLFFGAIGIGIVAALLPAFQAASTDIADTLTSKN